MSDPQKEKTVLVKEITKEVKKLEKIVRRLKGKGVGSDKNLEHLAEPLKRIEDSLEKQKAELRKLLSDNETK